MLRASSHCCRRSADGVLRYKDCWACCSRHTCLVSGLSVGSNTLTVQPERGMVRGGQPSCSKRELGQHPGLCSPGTTEQSFPWEGSRGVTLSSQGN